MTLCLRYSLTLLGLVLSLAILVTTESLTAGQDEDYQPPRTRDGKTDLNGIWQAVNTAQWDIQGHAAQPGPPAFGALFSVPAGRGVVVGFTIPYQEWALETATDKFREPMEP